MTQRTIDLVEMLLKQAGYKQEGQMYVHHTLKSAFAVQELFPKPESPTLPSVQKDVENIYYTDTEFPGIKVRMNGIKEFITDTFSETPLSDDKMNTVLKGIGYFACHRIKDAIANKQQSPSVGIGLVEALEKANPYEIYIGSEKRNGWQECCAKLRELIEVKTKTINDENAKTI